MNKFFINFKANTLHSAKQTISKVIKKIHNTKIVDFSYLMQNRRTITMRLFAVLLVSVVTVTALATPTPQSSTESNLYAETVYKNAIGSDYVVSLIQEGKIETSEIHTLDEDFLKVLEEEKLAFEEQQTKDNEIKAKYKRTKMNSKGSYVAPIATPLKGFIYYDVPLSYDWQVYTYNLCQEYGVRYEVMLGLMFSESNFRFNATSGVAWGICQIHQCHASYAKSIGIDNYKEPEGNILLGVKFLSNHLKEQDGDYHRALICYNYGSGGARKHCFSQGIYQTSYSRKVMNYADNLTPVQ